MHQVKARFPAINSRGVQFHVQTLSTSIPGARPGLAIDLNFLKSNPTLFNVKIDDIDFIFKAIDPLFEIPETAPINALKKLTYQRDVKSQQQIDFVPIELYAIIQSDKARLESAFESSITNGTDDPVVLSIGQRLLSAGVEAARQFIDVARCRYGQYWAEIPSGPLSWGYVLYFSRLRRNFFSLVVPENRIPPSLKSVTASRDSHFGHIVIDVISSRFAKRHQSAARPRTFADEMVAVALTELSTEKIRSGVIHAVIALEASAKSALARLVDGSLMSLSSPELADSISREVSLSTLARFVFENSASLRNSAPPEWAQIEQLCRSRNLIVHRRQRKLPGVARLREQVFQVKVFVDAVEGMLSGA